MSDLTSRLRADQIAARKGGDKGRTLVLGTVLASLKNRELELGAPLTDAEVTDVLRKQVKQRLDSVTQYRAGKREDLAEKEAQEIVVLRAYLPAEVAPAAIRAAADAAIAAGASDVGKLMGVLMAQFKGNADGKVINRIAREALQQG